MRLGAGLDGEGLLGAGQTCEVEDDRHPADLGLRRPVHAEAHGSANRGRLVTVEALHTCEAGVLFKDLDHAQ
jgi:hypothetical protein